MLIRRLAGIFKARGFVERSGRRPQFADCGFVAGPADIAIDEASGAVIAVGPHLDTSASGEVVLDGSGLVAVPGFVDSHTHALFAGDRSAEFFQRWAGRSYGEIAASGGGIHSTTRATNDASLATLRAGLGSRLRAMLANGTTTVEVKSGYANHADGELRLLRVMREVACDPTLPRVISTFLGLHALPPGRSERDYCDEMIEALPAVVAEGLAQFVDTFPERGFFSLEQALRFSRAARERGLGVKVHADELTDLGTSARFVAEGAVSIDHLQNISAEAIEALATADAVATVLPATSFFLGLPYANARRLIDSGARVALASDFNPGTAPEPNLAFTALLAAAQLRLSPAEILCALTVNAAAALRLGTTHGAIAPGFAADINLFPVRTTGTRLDPEDWLSALFLHFVPPTHTILRGTKAPRFRSHENG